MRTGTGTVPGYYHRTVPFGARISPAILYTTAVQSIDTLLLTRHQRLTERRHFSLGLTRMTLEWCYAHCASASYDTCNLKDGSVLFSYRNRYCRFTGDSSKTRGLRPWLEPRMWEPLTVVFAPQLKSRSLTLNCHIPSPQRYWHRIRSSLYHTKCDNVQRGQPFF